jgi:hypothetical protein
MRRVARALPIRLPALRRPTGLDEPMIRSSLLPALCIVSVASVGVAQGPFWSEGSMTVWGGAGWTMGACYYQAATHDPMGVIYVDGSRVNTYATSNGDHCEANGLARDTVAGGNRLSQTATAEGLHFCEWFYNPTPEEPLGEVEIQQDAYVEGSVTLTNQHCAGAGLGWAEATCNLLPDSLAVLTDSAAETIAGGLGDVSGAYAGISSGSANVSLGNGTFTDNDYAYHDTFVCVNYVFFQHRSRAYVKVSALRSAGSPGTTEADADMFGDCTTGALLWVCPHD